MINHVVLVVQPTTTMTTSDPRARWSLVRLVTIRVLSLLLDVSPAHLPSPNCSIFCFILLAYDRKNEINRRQWTAIGWRCRRRMKESCRGTNLFYLPIDTITVLWSSRWKSWRYDQQETEKSEDRNAWKFINLALGGGGGAADHRVSGFRRFKIRE